MEFSIDMELEFSLKLLLSAYFITAVGNKIKRVAVMMLTIKNRLI